MGVLYRHVYVVCLNQLHTAKLLPGFRGLFISIHAQFPAIYLYSMEIRTLVCFLDTEIE